MGPKSKAAVDRRWEAEERFQLHAIDELRQQRGVQMHILAELRRIAGMLETSLGQVHSDLSGLRDDHDALSRQTQEHERKLAAR